MKRYESYKDSGVKWLGEIPGHWEVLPLKYIFKLQKKLVGRNSNKYKLLSLTLQGIKVRDLENPTGKFPSSFDSYQIVEPGDFIFCNFDNEETPRAVGQSKFKGMITGAYDVFGVNNNNMDSNYLLYYCLYIDDAKRFKPLYKGLRKTIPFDSFMSYKIAIPSKAEQTAIANYLDSVTSKIDEAISQQQKMIDLLNERKQIIIQNAVTKGLDPNAKMKDSGVEWIGEIPEHWKVFKTLFSLSMPITDGPHETPELYDSGIPFISAEAITNGKIDFSHKRGYISDSFYKECCKKYIPKRNDIYMIKSGATTGRTAIVDTDEVFTIWSPLAVFRPNTNVIKPFFLLNVLRSTYYLKQVELNWSYGTQQNIGMRILEKLLICVPPLSEQEIIIAHINKSIIPINKAIDCANKMISLLQERKQIIINDVVTGKVKVI